MANTARAVGPVQLGLSGAPTTVYTCPASTTAIITTIDCCNTDSVTRLVTLVVVRSGGGPATAANALFWSRAIVDNLQYQGQVVLLAGDILQGYADAGAVVTVIAALVEET